MAIKYLNLFLPLACIATISASGSPIQYYQDGLYFNLISDDYSGQKYAETIDPYIWPNITWLSNNPEISSEQINSNLEKYKNNRNGLFQDSISLPSVITYNGTEYPVLRVGVSSFEYANNIKHVEIPNAVTHIDWCAFSKIENLKEISLPSSLRFFDAQAFGWSGITTLELPDSVGTVIPPVNDKQTINYSKSIPVPFSGYAPKFNYRCAAGNSSKIIRMPASKFAIYYQAFDDSQAETLVIPKTNEFFCHSEAFSNCKNLKNVISASIIPPTITEADSTLAYVQWESGSPIIFIEETAGPKADCIPYYPDWTDCPNGLLTDYTGTTLYVPKGSEESYSVAPIWRNFETIVGVSNIADLEATGDPTAIELTTREDTPDFNLLRNNITFCKHCNYEIYGLDGRKISSGYAFQNNTVTIPAGNYIIRTNDNTCKISIK